MHVVLKPNPTGDEEVIVQLAAVGGYSSFSKEELSAARLAADIVWGSGFSSLTPDQLSAHLYNHSIEFDYATKSFYRKIAGETDRESLLTLLDLIADFFTKPQFHKAGLDEVLQVSNESLQSRDLDHVLKYENSYFALNTQYDPSTLLLSKFDLEKISLEKVKNAFELLYGNPKDFYCIIVGDFAIDEVKKQVAASLGSLPAKPSLPLTIPANPIFPSTPTAKVVPLKIGCNSLTRLTLPIVTPLDETNFFHLEILSQAIEIRLRSIMQGKLKTSCSIDVAYEFPYYPSLTSPWLTIQFRSSFDQAEELAKMILSELKSMQNQGFKPGEIETVLRNQQNSDEFWQKEDEFWLSFLTNASLLGWDPEMLLKIKKESSFTSEIASKRLSKLIDISSFTRLTSKAE